MNFGEAIEALKQEAKVAREGWNGKNMWLIMVPGSEIIAREGSSYAKALGDNALVTINPHIDMFTADGHMQPGWLASQTDMLAEDWTLA